MTDQMPREKATAAAWFRQLRDEIVAAFEALEDSHDTGPLSDAEAGRFEVTETKRASPDGSDAGGDSAVRGTRLHRPFSPLVDVGAFGVGGRRCCAGSAAASRHSRVLAANPARRPHQRHRLAFAPG